MDSQFCAVSNVGINADLYCTPNDMRPKTDFLFSSSSIYSQMENR